MNRYGVGCLSRWAGSILIAMLVAAGIAPGQQGPGESPEIRQVMRMLQDASRALQAGNASSFLRFFDGEQVTNYGRLETHVVALTTQSDVASSISFVQLPAVEDGYLVSVDWLLQLSVKETPGPLVRRRKVLEFSVQAQKPGRWRITALDDVEFFRPQGQPGP